MSKRTMAVLAALASLSVLWVVFTPYGLGWTSLVCISVLGLVALWGMRWIGARSTRSMSQMIAEIEAEPMSAVATSQRAGAPLGGTEPVSKGSERK